MHVGVGVSFIAQQTACFTHGFHNFWIGFPDIFIGKEWQPRCVHTITHHWIENIFISKLVGFAGFEVFLAISRGGVNNPRAGIECDVLSRIDWG